MASIGANQTHPRRHAKLPLVVVMVLMFAASFPTCFEAPYSFHEVLQTRTSSAAGYYDDLERQQEAIAQIRKQALEKRAAKATAKKAEEQIMIKEQQELFAAVMASRDAVKKALSHAGARAEEEYEAQLQAQKDRMKKRAAKAAAFKAMQEQIRRQERQEMRDLSRAVVALGSRGLQFLGHAATLDEQEYKAHIRAQADAMKERAAKASALRKAQEQVIMQEHQANAAVAKLFGDAANKAREYAHAIDERVSGN